MSISRSEILVQLALASQFGHLGIFVGSGFSQALTKRYAPSFDKLICQVHDKLNLTINLNDIDTIRGFSYPQLASRLVDELFLQRYSIDKTFSKSKALTEFKAEVSRQCDLLPDVTLRQQYMSVLKKLSLSWTITTNYDFILETLIDNSVTLLPTQPLLPLQDFIPIYHLHGHRGLPDSIIITEEDYVGLFKPVDYRHLKLAMLLTESATLMLGYRVGDINVRSAKVWSDAISGGPNFRLESYQKLLIQALYVHGTPASEPYLGPNGEWIIEISDILVFLEELAAEIEKHQIQQQTARHTIENFLNSPTVVDRFMTDSVSRRSFAQIVSNLPRYYANSQIEKFIEQTWSPVWQSARTNGGWEHYNTLLNALIDLFVNIDIAKLQPSMFLFLALKLDSIASYVYKLPQPYFGYSLAASQSWAVRKSEIPTDTMNRLKDFAINQNRFSLIPLVT